MYQFTQPKYVASSFAGIYDKAEEAQSAYSLLTDQQILGLAYLKGCRDHVIKKQFSFMGSFDGRHRSGKSITASTFGYLWDPTFWTYYEQRIVQDHREFADAIEKIVKLKIPGAVIKVDEAGISMSSSDWYERWMKNLTQMIQMFGYLYPVVLFVAPVKDFVDSRLRKMIHAYYKMARYNLDYTTITAYDLNYNTVKNKYYYSKPRIRIDEQEVVLRRLILGRPPAQIIDRYMNLELSRKDQMMENFLNEMRKADVKEIREEVDLDKAIDRVAKNPELFMAKNSKPGEIKLDLIRIMYTLRLQERAAKWVKGEAEKKIEDFQRKAKETMEATGKDPKTVKPA